MTSVTGYGIIEEVHRKEYCESEGPFRSNSHRTQQQIVVAILRLDFKKSITVKSY